ncbi:MAG: hypothetical protein JNL11_15340 [Bdellovibrionaceae bacterium]|nr:hypothetical protein [Pseudobdellovibrionaceae bacterium]
MVKLFSVLLLPLFLHAALPSSQKLQKGIIADQGAVSGGVAGNGFSMLKMQLVSMPNAKMERYIFDIGDLKGHKIKGLPGFYHVQLVKNPPQMVIDFSQMPVSRVFENDLTKTLKKSVLVSNGKLVSDPVDKTLTMVLNLKKPGKMKVMQVKGEKETSKLVVDLYN